MAVYMLGRLSRISQKSRPIRNALTNILSTVNNLLFIEDSIANGNYKVKYILY